MFRFFCTFTVSCKLSKGVMLDSHNEWIIIIDVLVGILYGVTILYVIDQIGRLLCIVGLSKLVDRSA